MPPRDEEELDPVTLMNQALMNIEEDPSGINILYMFNNFIFI